MSPASSSGLNTLYPSLVNPPLNIISFAASTNMASDIKGFIISAIDFTPACTREAFTDSPVASPFDISLNKVVAGLTNVS